MDYGLVLLLLLIQLGSITPTLVEDIATIENFSLEVAPRRINITNVQTKILMVERNINDIFKLSLDEPDTGNLRITLAFECKTRGNYCDCNSFAYDPPKETYTDLTINRLFVIKDKLEVFNATVRALWHKKSALEPPDYCHQGPDEIDLIIHYLGYGAWYLDDIYYGIEPTGVLFRRDSFKGAIKLKIGLIENASLIAPEAQFATSALTETFLFNFYKHLRKGKQTKVYWALGAFVFCIILLLLYIHIGNFIKRNRVRPYGI